jgi:outer membrane receptor protein involved in Fe transport
VRLSSYTRVDVSAAWQVTPKFQAYLVIDNLTDQKYEEFVGNEIRGILPRAGVRFSL